jgi:HPt (histidine-containing phosphotransfer) domain-containing protein
LIEDLRIRFLPRFVETTRGRLARARSLFEHGDAPTLAHELHALAGEAMMLDLRAIAENARRGESAARAWSTSPKGEARPASQLESADDLRATCASCLETMGEALLALSNGALSTSSGGAP